MGVCVDRWCDEAWRDLAELPDPLVGATGQGLGDRPVGCGVDDLATARSHRDATRAVDPGDHRFRLTPVLLPVAVPTAGQIARTVPSMVTAEAVSRHAVRTPTFAPRVCPPALGRRPPRSPMATSPRPPGQRHDSRRSAPTMSGRKSLTHKAEPHLMPRATIHVTSAPTIRPSLRSDLSSSTGHHPRNLSSCHPALPAVRSLQLHRLGKVRPPHVRAESVGFQAERAGDRNSDRRGLRAGDRNSDRRGLRAGGRPEFGPQG